MGVRPTNKYLALRYRHLAYRQTDTHMAVRPTNKYLALRPTDTHMVVRPTDKYLALRYRHLADRQTDTHMAMPCNPSQGASCRLAAESLSLLISIETAQRLQADPANPGPLLSSPCT